MIERLKNLNVDDLEITSDFLSSESFRIVFLGELSERRNDLISRLIETGSDEARYKIQMIDEILGFSSEIGDELKSRKDSMG